MQTAISRPACAEKREIVNLDRVRQVITLSRVATHSCQANRASDEIPSGVGPSVIRRLAIPRLIASSFASCIVFYNGYIGRKLSRSARDVISNVVDFSNRFVRELFARRYKTAYWRVLR